MRSAIIGAYFADDPLKRHAFVSASTRLTHTDPKADTAALAIAEAVAWISNGAGTDQDWLTSLPALGTDDEWPRLCQKLTEALARQASVQELANSLGLNHGVTGYAYHTAPVALYAWLRHRGDFRAGLQATLDCGGDTDTAGAIFGALMGAAVGPKGIPVVWLDHICEWPRSAGVMGRIAERLAQQKTKGKPLGPVRYFWPVLILRNLMFLVIVLAHGFRRLAPPY
jgi:ADP-ribosylglycohydrolase